MRLGGWIDPGVLGRVLGEDIGAAMPLSMIGVGKLEALVPGYFQTLRTRAGRIHITPDWFDGVATVADIEDPRLFVETLPPRLAMYKVRFIHHRLARALAMMKQIEEQQGFRFEYIMRIRPDLEAAPPLDPEVADEEIWLDWHEELDDGTPLGGDNAILAKRDVMFALAEFMRAEIYENLNGDVHRIIGKFVATNGLKARWHGVRIAEDCWPRAPFIKALEDAARGQNASLAALEFLACARAHMHITRHNFEAAATELAAVASSSSQPVMLARGRLALGLRDIAGADKQLNRLRPSELFNAFEGGTFYRERLRRWRMDYAAAQSEAGDPIPDFIDSEEVAKPSSDPTAFELVEDTPAAAELRRLSNLKPFLQMLEEKWRQTQDAFEGWEEVFRQKVYGEGLMTGNRRLYALRLCQWFCTIHDINAAVREFNAKVRTNFEELLLSPSPPRDGADAPDPPGTENMLNIDGTEPDSARQQTHRELMRFRALTVERMETYFEQLRRSVDRSERTAFTMPLHAASSRP